MTTTMTPRQRWLALLNRQSVDRIPTDYRNARWICAPCHRLQPVTPTANIVALYETIHALG